MGDVIESHIITTLPLSADKILERAIGTGLGETVIVSYDRNDNIAVASTTSDVGHVLLLLERAKDFVLRSTATGSPNR